MRFLRAFRSYPGCMGEQRICACKFATSPWRAHQRLTQGRKRGPAHLTGFSRSRATEFLELPLGQEKEGHSGYGDFRYGNPQGYRTS
jgi:hypothetical protein